MVSEVKLKYISKGKEDYKVTTSAKAYEVVRPLFDNDTINYVESVWMLCLNRANNVIACKHISSGGTSGTVIDPKIIFTTALLTGASAVIMVHNHPSGNLKASNMDIKITEKLIKGGKLLDILVLDHLIVSEDNYLSMSDEGLI